MQTLVDQLKEIISDAHETNKDLKLSDNLMTKMKVLKNKSPYNLSRSSSEWDSQQDISLKNQVPNERSVIAYH